MADGVDPFAALRSDFEAHGDVLHAYEGDTSVLTIRHPDHIHELLITRANDFVKRPHDLGPFLGQGLLTSDGELWRRQRQLIQPSFHKDRIRSYAPIIVDETERMLDRWPDGESIDVAGEMMGLSLAIVCLALFGHALTEADPIGQAIRMFGSDLPRPSFAVFRQRHAMQTIDGAIRQLIEDRHANPRPLADDLLSGLCIDGQMSAEQLRDELVTMLLAGHETTANALSWTFHLLAQNPTYWDAVEDPALMSCVASESMRLYPPAYAICRTAKNATQIADRAVEPGAQVIASTYCCHRDPRWFPEPDRFDPDRFGATSKRALNPLAYLPFGIGARSCVGKAFGMLELCTVVPAVARRFRLEAQPPDVVCDPAITLRPKDGLPMIAHRLVRCD